MELRVQTWRPGLGFRVKGLELMELRVNMTAWILILETLSADRHLMLRAQTRRLGSFSQPETGRLARHSEERRRRGLVCCVMGICFEASRQVKAEHKPLLIP